MDDMQKTVNTLCADFEHAYNSAMTVRTMFIATRCYVTQKGISNTKKRKCLNEFDKLLERLLNDMENSYAVSVRLKVV